MIKCNCGTCVVEGGAFVLPLPVSTGRVLFCVANEMSSTPVADVAEGVALTGSAGLEATVLEELCKASCGEERALGAELPLDAV